MSIPRRFPHQVVRESDRQSALVTPTPPSQQHDAYVPVHYEEEEPDSSHTHSTVLLQSDVSPIVASKAKDSGFTMLSPSSRLTKLQLSSAHAPSHNLSHVEDFNAYVLASPTPAAVGTTPSSLFAHFFDQGESAAPVHSDVPLKYRVSDPPSRGRPESAVDDSVSSRTPSRASNMSSALPPSSNVRATTQMAPSPLPVNPAGFSDQRLIQQLHLKILDRHLLEQWLVLQDAHHAVEDCELEEVVERRHQVWTFSLQRHILAMELKQRDALDALMIKYGASNYVPSIRSALQARSDVVRLELAEVEDAIEAVERQTAKETAAAEDELVEFLSNVREERRLLMDQLQHAEAARAGRFESQKDAFIDKNYSSTLHDVNPSTEKRYGGQPLDLLRVGTKPRDLWVAQTLPSATRLATARNDLSTTREAGRELFLNKAQQHTSSSRHIDISFPLPPLPKDLESIQKAQVPSLSGSRVSAAANTNLTKLVPADGSMRLIGNNDEAFAADRQQSAAYYRSFLEASRSPLAAKASSTTVRDSGESEQHTAAEMIEKLTKNLLGAAAAGAVPL